MTKPSPISLRIKVPATLAEKISIYRHEARHDSKNAALIALLAAGLEALQSRRPCRQASRSRRNGSSPMPAGMLPSGGPRNG